MGMAREGDWRKMMEVGCRCCFVIAAGRVSVRNQISDEYPSEYPLWASSEVSWGCLKLGTANIAGAQRKCGRDVVLHPS